MRFRGSSHTNRELVTKTNLLRNETSVTISITLMSYKHLVIYLYTYLEQRRERTYMFRGLR